jgi:hypothetical protein
MTEINPNQVHHEKRVIVVGGVGGASEAKHYKGYKGTIKKTNRAGAVSVELDACQQKVVQLFLSDLALLLVSSPIRVRCIS